MNLIPALTTAMLLLATCAQAAPRESIRFGVLSIAQPARIHAQWQNFTDHMSGKTGYPMEIIVPRGFRNMAKAIAAGKMDVFYINSYVYLRLKQGGHAVALAQMKNIDGQLTSQSQIFARRDSGITHINQLRGKTLAFVSPMGAGGYLAPRAFLYKHGFRESIDYRETFTRSLSNSIHGVLLNDYTAGSMCGINFKLMSRKIATGELAIIGLSDPYPENLLAARPDLNPDFKKRFIKELFSLAHTATGQKTLAKLHGMKIKEFVPYDEGVERITRALVKSAALEKTSRKNAKNGNSQGKPHP